MTTQQQDIIDALTAEFTRINKANASKKSFNLINVDALQEHTRANREFAELSKQDLATWELAAYAEMERIIELLIQDLPEHVMIDRYDEHIGKYRRPQIQIRHWSVSPRTHYENVVSIDVIVNRVSRRNEYGEHQYFGEGLQYMVCGTDCRFDTIEEAVSHKSFQDLLRKRVIR